MNATVLSRRDGMIRGAIACPLSKATQYYGKQIIPYPTGRGSGSGLPRHFMPGYPLAVPPGQKSRLRAEMSEN